MLSKIQNICSAEERQYPLGRKPPKELPGIAIGEEAGQKAEQEFSLQLRHRIVKLGLVVVGGQRVTQVIALGKLLDREPRSIPDGTAKVEQCYPAPLALQNASTYVFEVRGSPRKGIFLGCS